MLYVPEYILQKRVRKDKVDADVLPLRAQHAVADVLVQEQDVPARKAYLFAADDVRHAARVHIHELHVVVPVLGEVGKTGVQAHVDLPPAEQLFAVYDKFFARRIVVLADRRLPAEDARLLGGERRQPFDHFCVHMHIVTRFA